MEKNKVKSLITWSSDDPDDYREVVAGHTYSATYEPKDGYIIKTAFGEIFLKTWEVEVEP